MKKTKIRWASSSWNPVTGCTEVSPGCQNCYAKRIAENYRGPAFLKGFDITLRPHKLGDPFKWKQPRMVFVNSMSELFHRDIPRDYLAAIWDTMLRADHHVYQVLTKRPHRMAHLIREMALPLRERIWLVTSTENQAMADNRIPALLGIGAPVSWISAEPLLGPLDLSQYVDRLDRCVVGSESGSGRRPMDYNWARDLRDQCVDAGCAFFSIIKPPRVPTASSP